MRSRAVAVLLSVLVSAAAVRADEPPRDEQAALDAADAEARRIVEEQERRLAQKPAPPPRVVPAAPPPLAPQPGWDDAKPARREKVLGIVLGSVGLALGVAGATLGGLAARTTNELDAQALRGAYDPALDSRGRAYTIAGSALGALGGVLLITGVVFTTTGALRERAARKLALASSF